MWIEAPTDARVPSLRRLWKEAFGDSDAYLDLFFHTAFSVHRARCLVTDDDVRAALYWFDCEFDGRRIAYLYAIATERAYRGRGLCRTLMEDTHRHLAALGYDGVLLVPANEGLFSLYAGLGYTTATEVCEYTATAADEGIALTAIDVNEYFALRRTLLPMGGVVQEQGLASFLSAQANFLKGEGLLLAYRKEGERLRGLELLGNPTLASHALFSLGVSHGSFRSVGEGRPFAMYLPLGDGVALSPSYFGLALD